MNWDDPVEAALSDDDAKFLSSRLFPFLDSYGDSVRIRRKLVVGTCMYTSALKLIRNMRRVKMTMEERIFFPHPMSMSAEYASEQASKQR